jgi:hypothetical protein
MEAYEVIQNQKKRKMKATEDLSLVLGICTVVIGLVSLQVFHFLAIFTFSGSIVGLIKTNEVIRKSHTNVTALTYNILGMLVSILSMMITLR